MENKRNLYFDFLKGVAIVMVVFIHTNPTEAGEYDLFLRQMLNTAVPIFLACSGFFLTKYKISTASEYKEFLKHQVSKVYLPMIFWALPLYFLQIRSGNDVIVTTLYLLFGGISIYYFIFLIVQFYLILPIFNSHSLRKLIVTCIISSISIILATYIIPMPSNNLLRGGWFPLWIVFFSLGLYLGGGKSREYNLKPWCIIALLSIILCYCEAKFLYSLGVVGDGIKFSSFIFSFSTIMILFSRKVEVMYSHQHILNRIFTYIGSISFGIYLTHCYWIMIVQKLHLSNWLLDGASVLLLTIIFIYLKRIVTSKFKLIIGF